MDDREQRAEAWRERYDETGFGEDVKTAYLDGAESEAAHWKERLEPLLKALEHIADQASRRDCCKFAVMARHRRRHLKEVADEAIADYRAGKESDVPS